MKKTLNTFFPSFFKLKVTEALFLLRTKIFVF